MSAGDNQNPRVHSGSIKPRTKEKEKNVQVSARIPASVHSKIKAVADERYQGKLAMVVRELLVNATKKMLWE